MARVYTATFSGVTYTGGTPRDVFEVITSSTQIAIIHSIFIGNYGVAEYGDAQAEGMWVRLIRASGSYTTGSGGGGAVTPAPHDFAAAAFGGTVRANSATIAAVGSGTFTTLMNETFNIQAGWYHTPTPEERIIINPSQALIVTFPDDGTLNPSGDLTKVTARITFEALGAA